MGRYDSDELIGLIVRANRALGAAGQGDLVWGHVSLRDPLGRGFWMKASGLGFEEVGPAEVLLVAFDGEVLEGRGPRHIEFPIHGEIMRMRPDVQCVVHTHSPAANALSSLGVPLRALSHEGVLFTHPEVPRFLRTGGLIKTRDLGVFLAEALGEAPACLMPRHGLVAVGSSVASGVMTAVLLDKACRVQLAAMAAGEPVLWSDEDEVASKRDEIWNPPLLEAGWRYLCRQTAPSDAELPPRRPDAFDDYPLAARLTSGDDGEPALAAAPGEFAPSTSELEWMERNSSLVRASLPNGYCIRPTTDECPSPDDCLSCSFFVTAGRFLPVHRQHEQTLELLIARAESGGYPATAERHRRIEHSVRVVIRALETSSGVITGGRGQAARPEDSPARATPN